MKNESIQGGGEPNEEEGTNLRRYGNGDGEEVKVKPKKTTTNRKTKRNQEDNLRKHDREDRNFMRK